MEAITVTSRQNPIVKNVCALADKKNRTKSGLFRFDGAKLLSEALDARLELEYIIFREDMREKAAPMIESALALGAIDARGVICVNESVFEKISEERAPEGIITVAKMKNDLHMSTEADNICLAVESGESILIAESLRDPGNLGTVMRSAYALGIDKLVLTSDCADIYNAKTIRAGMGAIFKLPTVTVSCDGLAECIRQLKTSGRKVYATALDQRSVDISSIKLERGDCFLIGNEGHGLTQEAIDACSGCVIIPMREGAESLNAAAAAAICLWETVRSKGGI